jgi:hypothetical protein
VGGIGCRQRQLRGGTAQVPLQHHRVGGVADGGLRRPVEQLLRVSGQEAATYAPRAAANINVNSMYLGGGNARDAVPPVVVQFSPAAENTVDAMEEDLAVMTRIIAKALQGELGEEPATTKMGIRMLVTGDGRSVRAMYLEGFGALFMIKVNFPLLPPPKVEAKRSESTANSEWEKAKLELQGIVSPNEDGSDSVSGGPGSDYNEDQVATLKKTLLMSLKNASNIRHLKSDDTVVVSVFGSPNGGPGVPAGLGGFERAGRFGGGAGGGFGGGGGGGYAIAGSPGLSPPTVKKGRRSSTPPATPPVLGDLPDAESDQPAPEKPAGLVTSYQDGRVVVAEAKTGRIVSTTRVGMPKDSARRGTVLALRVKKSDVDAFAKGNLSYEEFQQRVAMNAYKGSGHGITSLNSWIDGGRTIMMPDRQ